ncbi:MAG: 6-phosphogluconolactonase, partial [Syntrophorhabdaceae bacterium]
MEYSLTGNSINDILAAFHHSRNSRSGKQRKVIVFGNEAQCSAFIAALWREICSETVQERPFLNVALSGGKSPVGVYGALARERDVPWQMIHVFMVDERFVPQDDEDSNFGMLRSVLFDRVPIPQENIHPVKTNCPGPVEAARDYEERISKHFNLK